jgi:hypothetical protein
MLVLSVRFRKPDMLEEPMPGKRYVSLSALSGIFCSVGDDVLPPRGVLKFCGNSNDLQKSNTCLEANLRVIGRIGDCRPGKEVLRDGTHQA